MRLPAPVAKVPPAPVRLPANHDQEAIPGSDIVRICLVALMKDRNSSKAARAAVARALSEVCPDPSGVAQGLGRIVLDPYEFADVRRGAATMLSQFCEGPNSVSAFLNAILADRSCEGRIRRAAAFALRVTGKNSPSVQALTRVLIDSGEDAGLRREVAHALGGLGADAAGEMDSLSGVLEDRDGSTPVRLSAATALVRLGNGSRPDDPVAEPVGTAAPSLLDSGARGVWATQIVGENAGDRSLQLVRVMADRNDSLALRIGVARALGDIERPGPGVSNALTGIIQDRTEEPALRVAAVVSLGKFVIKTGRDRDLTIERLMPIMSVWDESPEVNSAAFGVLAAMGLSGARTSVT